MRIILTTGLLVTLLTSTTAFAQIAPQEQNSASSTAGRAAAMQTVTASVLVTGIDKATRSLTLKDAQGKETHVVAGPDVRNFDQIKVNDAIDVEIVRSVSLALTQADASKEISETYVAGRAEKGAEPAAAIGRRISAIAEVIAVDQAGNTITLQGPRGRIVEIEVKNPDQFKVVKVGSRVQVEYTEAVALSVKPSAAAANKK